MVFVSSKKSTTKSCLALTLSLCCSSFVYSSNASAHSYDDASSIPQYHPLCLPEARLYEGEGGAFDMQACAEKWSETPVKLTPNKAFFAKRPTNIDGESQGYVVYQPLGTLDKSLELILVHDKQADSQLAAAVYVLGRLPNLSENHRDFLTSIDQLGSKCRGGIQSAKLISEEILEVSFNVNAYTLMSLLSGEQALDTIDSNSGSQPESQNSLSSLDNRDISCVGSVAKHFNLLKGTDGFASVTFAPEGSSLVPENQTQKCFESLVRDFVSPSQRLISVEDFYTFSSLYKDECSK